MHRDQPTPIRLEEAFILEVSTAAMTTGKNLRIGVDVGGHVLYIRVSRVMRLILRVEPTLTESSLIL